MNTYEINNAFNDTNLFAYPHIASAINVAALSAIPPPKAHQNAFRLRAFAHNNHATLTADAAHADETPTTRPNAVFGSRKQRTNTIPTTTATTAPSTAARAPVLSAAEVSDESIESNSNPRECAREHAPRRRTKMCV